jgi:hypothetical protein
MTRAGERAQRHGAWQLDRQFARGDEPMKLSREAVGAAGRRLLVRGDPLVGPRGTT